MKDPPPSNNGLVSFSTIKSLISEIDSFSKTTGCLVGSYAQKSATRSSDLDFLIITKEKQKNQIVKYLEKIIKEKFQKIISKIDCKVISWRDFQKGLSTNYLVIYSMISSGYLLVGEPIQIKLIPEQLNQELNRLIKLDEEIENSILYKQNFTMTATLLFNLGKSFHFLERIISPSDFLSLKQIWGRNLFFLGNLYEKVISKGVTSSLITPIVLSKQRSGNFNRLSECFIQLQSYKVRVNRNFQNWYDSY